MTDETKEQADDGPDLDAKMGAVMRMLAYRDVVQRFNESMSAIFHTRDDDQREALAKATLHLKELAASLDPSTVLSAALIVVTEKTAPDGQPGFALHRGLIGSNNSLDALLPLVHLLFGFERDGVMPPDLTGTDVEIAVTHDTHPTEQ